MSRVTKTSKTYPGIKVSHDATDFAPKPYEGYHRGGGMPGAREVVEDYSTQARKTFDKAFKHKGDKLLANATVKDKCSRSDCNAYSTRKSSGCVLFPFDISKCEHDKRMPNEQRTKKKRRKDN